MNLTLRVRQNKGWFKKGQTQRKGCKATPETIKRLRLSHLGKKPSAETRIKMKLNKSFLGKHHSEESKKKMSLAKEKRRLLKNIQPVSQSKLERIKFHDTMQKLIFERDNYKCQICGKGGNLQVDHIASWAEFKELRFDPNNCRTLCAKCHYKITFGREMPDNIKIWGHNLRNVI